MTKFLPIFQVILSLALPIYTHSQGCTVRAVSESEFMQLVRPSAPKLLEDEIQMRERNGLFYLRVGNEIEAIHMIFDKASPTKIEYFDFKRNAALQLIIKRRMPRIAPFSSASLSCFCEGIHGYHSMEVLLIKWEGASFRLESLQSAIIPTIIANKEVWPGVYAMFHFVMRSIGDDLIYLGEKKNWKR